MAFHGVDGPPECDGPEEPDEAIEALEKAVEPAFGDSPAERKDCKAAKHSARRQFIKGVKMSERFPFTGLGATPTFGGDMSPPENGGGGAPDGDWPRSTPPMPSRVSLKSP